MTTEPRWKLINEDSTVVEFIDIRRKVGNQIIRAYLLKGMSGDRIKRIRARLRGPQDEFKDFATFLIMHAKDKDTDFQILVEAGVYENLRIVGTDSEEFAQWSSNEIIHAFTNALEKPDANNTSIILSADSTIL